MISIGELKIRNDFICSELEANGLDGLLLTEYANIVYISSFFHITTERPIALYLNKGGETILFVPNLELEEARTVNTVDDVIDYFEFPGTTEVYSFMFSHIKEKYPSCKNIGVDGDSRSLFAKLELAFNQVKPCKTVNTMRLIKTDEEVELLKKAAHYNDYIVQMGLELVHDGISELELLLAMQNKTIQKMIAELPRVVFVGGGVATGLIPSGIRSALPHALPSAKKVALGESMMFSCGASVEGYVTECERTCFIGEPSQRHIDAFNVMVKAQEFATSLMVEGAICSEIDKKVLDYIRSMGYGEYIRHRTGHGKGLLKHEAPWVEVGDHTVLKSGMVLSSEPAIYIEGFAGFRHSDTIVVQKGAPLVLTKFARDLESLTVCV